jgi:aspartate carbamoyltransferase regulatory subunit
MNNNIKDITLAWIYSIITNNNLSYDQFFPFRILNDHIQPINQINSIKQNSLPLDSIKINEKKEEDKITKLPIFKCNFNNCGKSYKSKENLTIHYQNKHEGIKPFKCSFCNNMFSQRNGKNII